MTWTQYAEAGAALAQARLNGTKLEYQPDFTKCVDHFLIHVSHDWRAPGGQAARGGGCGTDAAHPTPAATQWRWDRLACTPMAAHEHRGMVAPRGGRGVAADTAALSLLAGWLQAGGWAVLQGIREGMKLPISAMLPSFAALHEYGNTSSSTTW